MAYVDVLAPALTLDGDSAALTAAGEIASTCGAHVAALVVAVHMASVYADKGHTLSEVLADIAKGSRSEAGREREKIVAWLQQTPHDFEIRDVTVEAAVDEHEVVAHARLADLVVMARAAAHDRARRAMLEHVLFKSGRPVLLVPGEPPRERRWRRAVIGWNAKAEAVRALTAALPLLQRAEEVAVATVDASPSRGGHGQGPGREIAAHLARHGVNAVVRNLDSLGRGEAKTLLDEAVAFDADMLVMGAYGHSRTSEALFGGVTRDLLAAAPVPLFLMH